MTDDLEKEIKLIFKLVTSYAVDFFNVKSLDEAKKIDNRLFINKCHEGFYLAQEKIINNLLRIEAQLKSVRVGKSVCEKYKHKMELIKDLKYQELLLEEKSLEQENLLFRRLADTIAWTILKSDKILIRSTQTGTEHHGYLLDKNIQSLLDVIKKFKKEDEFILINDITLSVGNGAGDLLRIRKGDYDFCEVKDGVVNEQISDCIDYVDNLRHDGYNEYGKSDEKKILEKFAPLFIDGNKLKQLERTLRQFTRMQNVLDYNKNKVGVDIRIDKDGQESGRLKILNEAKNVKDKHLFDVIKDGFDRLRLSEREYYLVTVGRFLYFLFTVNQKGDIFNNNLSGWVRRKNAQHLLFHEISNDVCRYITAKTEQDWKEAFEKELQVYKDLIVLDWTEQILSDGSLCPPFLFPFDEELILDLLFERRSIFVYFDSDSFINFVNSLGFNFLEMKKLDRVTYDRADIEYKIHKNGGRVTLGWGMLFRMMLEFQDPVSFIEQIVEVYHQD